MTKPKTAWSEATRSKATFTGRGDGSYVVTLNPVPYDSPLITYDDNNCLYDGPKYSVTRPITEERTIWTE